ncbi:MAG TPA: hypothetical protein VH394_16570 [Thermoanaerobaculia bacterium]|jgi:hypothetical protein|nr:hypothetical protein [Thermoanaerobaculia bacterium]
MTWIKVRYVMTMAPLLFVASLAIGCRGREVGAQASNAPLYGCTADGGQLQIQFPPGGPPIVCPSFPNTTPTGQPSWDYFAWNSFIAANWPALDPSTNNNQRGFPDLTKNFVTASSSDLLVWETFKEKRELFQPYFDRNTEEYYANDAFTPNPPGPTPPGPWNQALNYGPLDPITQKPYDFPLCTGSARPGHAMRQFAQLGKLGIDSGSGPDSLDETIEVASEALESPSQLCAGNTKNPCAQGEAPCSCIQGMQVGPRVFKKAIGEEGQSVPVRYEVKVNYDYYQYVGVNNPYWQYAAGQTAAGQGISLPFRTSAAAGPPNSPPGTPPGTLVTAYDAQGCIDTYSSVTATSNLTPCPAGSIQIKTAWIPLVNGEDPSTYHTANAAIFKTQPNPSNPKQQQTCIDYDGPLFGLVAMHIIQRIHQGAGGGASHPQGGTYIFATWEHVDNDKAGFVYTNFLPPQVNPSMAGYYPGLMYLQLLPVTRKFPILSGTANVNTVVHNAIRQINPDSVWLNYQLIGTQFQPINLPTPEQPPVPPFPTTLPNPDPTNIGQNAYLANTVVETNDGLQLFRGLPPNVIPIMKFINNPNLVPGTLPGNPSTNTYARNAQNVVFPSPPGPPKIQGYTMGGCMGCHGVAQLKGTAFSFILLEGQAGADVDTEEDFTVAPLSPTDFTTDFGTDFTTDFTDLTSGPP